MIHQTLRIPHYDWRLDICYDARSRDAAEIMASLYKMGCSEYHLDKACDLIHSGIANQGLTYTDRHRRHSLVVICHVTSVGQFINTLTHEIDHLNDHISQYYNIPYSSEENSYLMGDVMEMIYNNALQTIKFLLND